MSEREDMRECGHIGGVCVCVCVCVCDCVGVCLCKCVSACVCECATNFWLVCPMILFLFACVQIPQLRRSSPTESPLTPRGTPGGTFLRGGEKVPHLAVMSRGQLYTMDLFHADGISLTVEEIQQQLETILEMSKRAQAGHDAQAPIGILTTEERDTWARLRGKLIEAHPDNQQALHAVESAMFLLVLEGACPEAIEDQAKTMFLGDGRNRWYDKSFQLIVFENACAGVNVEGSWADAPVASHLFGFMHDHENMARFANRSSPNLNPASAGAVADKLSPRLAPPKKLTWRLTSELAEGMDRAQIHFDALADRTDLHVMHMRYFGKGFIKKCQMSPDAFVQMALQVSVCCSVVQCVGVCCRCDSDGSVGFGLLQCVAVYCRVLRMALQVSICCSVLQCA